MCQQTSTSTTDHTEIKKAAKQVVQQAEARRTDVFEPGRLYARQHGGVHTLVDAKRPKVSGPATDLAELLYILRHGWPLTIVKFEDGSSSFSDQRQQVLLQIGDVRQMVAEVFPHRHVQLAIGMVQDYADPILVGEHDYNRDIRLAITQTMFEGDTIRVLEQMGYLNPTNGGGDSTEDYQLALLQALYHIDAVSLVHGYAPYVFITGDQVGRTYISTDQSQHDREDTMPADMVQYHLGFPMGDMETATIGAQLAKKAHVFYLCTSNRRSTHNWWNNVLGEGRCVYLANPKHEAVMQAAIVYVTEKSQVTGPGVINFIQEASAKTDYPVSSYEARAIYEALVEAGVPFGAQPQNYCPPPGAKFDHPRAPYPIGHELYRPYAELGLIDPTAEDYQAPFVPLKDANDIGVVGLPTVTGTSDAAVIASPAPNSPAAAPTKPTVPDKLWDELD